MGKEQSGIKEGITRYTPEAIILCTTPRLKKDLGMRESIVHEFDGIPIFASNPEDIPESLYNQVINKDPGAIAATKALQVARHHDVLMQESFLPRDVSKGDVLYIANDVVLEVPRKMGGPTWDVVNKPKPDASEQEIRQKLHDLLIVQQGEQHGYVEARFRCGGACYSPKEERGIFGTLEIPFWFSNFSESDIEIYMEKYKGALHSTNGSCRWSDPEIFDPHLLMVANVMKDDQDFVLAKKFFQRALLGGLPGIGTLIDQTSLFVGLKTFGYQTSFMNDINKRFLGYEKIGSWGTWRTHAITYKNTLFET
jgi:hypothetical protein